MEVDLVLYSCESGKEALCRFLERRLVVPLRIDPESKEKEIRVDYEFKRNDPAMGE